TYLSKARRLVEKVLRTRAGFRAHARQGNLMTQNADTVADPPYWMASPSKPKLKLPPGVCDAHVHVFGPRKRFPSADDRHYTPCDPKKERLFTWQEEPRVQHGGIVQPACHDTDNRVTADATAATGQAYKGVGLIPLTISEAKATRRRWSLRCALPLHNTSCQ